MQVGFYLLVIRALERLKICHWVLDSYTDLNSDHAARFTSASLRVNSWASPAKQRAISEFRWSMTGVPRSIAPEIAKYWFGIRHRSLAPTAASASASLKPDTLRKRFRTRRTRSGFPSLRDTAGHGRRSTRRRRRCKPR